VSPVRRKCVENAQLDLLRATRYESGVGKVLVLSSVVLVFIYVAAVPAAPARDRPALKTAPCQTTTDGHRWLVAPRGLSCSDAKKVVQTLAKKRVPRGSFFPGTYQGMRCVSTSRTGTKPQYIGCVSKNHSRSMVAFRQ
jgi:hypothetical protein